MAFDQHFTRILERGTRARRRPGGLAARSFTQPLVLFEAQREVGGAGQLDLAIVSLDLEPEAQALFEALATEIDATYIDVKSFEALEVAVREALNTRYEVVDSSGTVVARGQVGAESLELPMGVYDVRVLSTPVQEFKEVRVPSASNVVLRLR